MKAGNRSVLPEFEEIRVNSYSITRLVLLDLIKMGKSSSPAITGKFPSRLSDKRGYSMSDLQINHVTEFIEQLKKSKEQIGDLSPVIVDSDGEIIRGNIGNKQVSLK